MYIYIYIYNTCKKALIKIEPGLHPCSRWWDGNLGGRDLKLCGKKAGRRVLIAKSVFYLL